MTMNYPHAIIHFVFTLLIYLGLPLLGWGLDDLEGFFSDPARAGFALLTGLGAILAAYQGLVIPEGQDRKEKRVVRQTVFLGVFELLGMALLILLPYCDRRGIAVIPDNQGWRFVGLALSGLGGGFMFWSVLNLGRQYSAEVTINGVIALNRPMGTEAAAGKNPVSHVGKIYNLLTHRIAQEIYTHVPGLSEAYVWLCSQIGNPIDRPLIASAQLVLQPRVGLADTKPAVESIICC